jgi:hypothetical protein
MKTILSIALLLSAMGANAQQSVPISDISASGNPVTLSGSVVFSATAGTQPAITLKGNNVSGKEIIALRAQFTATDSMGFKTTILYEHDNFFKSNGMSAGEEWNLLNPSEGISVDPSGFATQPSTPSAQAKTTFAQFSDGSTWGDTAVSQDVSEQRAKVKQFLEEAESAYLQQGTKALSDTLAKYHSDRGMAGSLTRQLLKFQAISGSEATAENIKQRLSIALTRERKFATAQ